MTRRLLVTLVVVGLLAGQASAVEMFEKVGTIGFQFLEIGAGPRGTAMGEAMVAATDGIESLYWNPAGLRTITTRTALFTYGTWPADITHQFAGFAMRPGFVPGIIGISVTSLQMDAMPITTADQQDGVGSDFKPSDLAVGLTYTRILTDRFSAGGTVRWFHSSLGDLSGLGVEGLEDYVVDGVVGDFGTLYDTGFRSLKIGLCIQNIGADATYIEEPVPVPTTFKFGVSMDVVDTARQTVTVAAEFRHPSDTSEKVNVGAEYTLNKRYFLRAGYKMNYDEESFTAGGGAKLTIGGVGRVGVDYSYTDFGLLGGVHRVGATVEF